MMEPTAALDLEITAQIVSIIQELTDTGITQVIVTHEVEVARKTASHYGVYGKWPRGGAGRQQPLYTATDHRVCQLFITLTT